MHVCMIHISHVSMMKATYHINEHGCKLMGHTMQILGASLFIQKETQNPGDRFLRQVHLS